MKVLHLNLKKKYFQEIQEGQKKEEFRLYKNFWKQRLLNKEYDEIHIKLGFPKKGDSLRILIFPWRGFQIKEILHPEFGSKPVKVFSIKLVKGEEDGV